MLDGLVFDIETAPIPNLLDHVDVKQPPRTYKTEKARAKHAERAIEHEALYAALDPDLCRVVCLGLWEIGKPEPKTYIVRDEEEEAKLLRWFWRRIQSRQAGIRNLIGFNILEFDLPVLLRRSLYLDVTAPEFELGRFRRHSPIVDLKEKLQMWRNGRPFCRSKDWYCKRFGINVPDPVTGGSVPELVLAGQWDLVASHCHADCVKEMLLAQRLGIVEVDQQAPAEDTVNAF